MQLTKFSHACVRLEDGDRSLVIDPGVFSEADEALDGASAVLITHEHPDHLNADAVRSAARRDPRLRIWAPQSVVDSMADLGEQVVVAAAGQSFDVEGFAVRTFGGQHAVIHPTIPVIANVAYLIDGTVYHPGDSFAVPTEPVPVLLVPTIAPWSKAAEVIDFTISVRAPRAFQIHDSIGMPTYHGLVENQIRTIAGPFGVEFRHLDPRETVTL